MSLKEKAAKIKAIVLDVDGVLTDGLMGYGAHEEIKFFNVRDGHGIKMAIRSGLKVGILSGRSSNANRKRAEELGLDFIYEGQKDKAVGFRQLLQENDLKAEECLYIGDDVIDIPVLRQVGVAVAVADASDELTEFCDFRTENGGGRGAVREVIEWLLKEQGKWQDLMKRYVY